MKLEERDGAYMGDNKEKNTNEYNNMCRQSTRKKTELENAKTKNKQIDEKIRRLQKAYREIDSVYKHDLFDLKQKQKRYIDDEKRWQGSTKKEYYSSPGSDIKKEMENYYLSVNRDLLDNINKSISALKCQKYTDSFLGRLAREIIELNTSIKNYFN